MKVSKRVSLVFLVLFFYPLLVSFFFIHDLHLHQSLSVLMRHVAMMFFTDEVGHQPEVDASPAEIISNPLRLFPFYGVFVISNSSVDLIGLEGYFGRHQDTSRRRDSVRQGSREQVVVYVCLPTMLLLEHQGEGGGLGYSKNEQLLDIT